MFVFSNWDKFCKSVAESDLKTIRADEILLQDQNSKWVVFKHDVETRVWKALEMAKIETKYGISATYYFQSYLLEPYSDILREIQNMGHEVSYHYDVLDANSGNYERASREFASTVQKFELLGFKVNTICPHGNPVMIRAGWNSNKDFFKDGDIRGAYPHIFDIVVDSKLKIPKGFAYISDAGYGWKKIGNIYDNDKYNTGDTDLGSLDAVVSELRNENCFIISCHPHRWEKLTLKATYNLYLFKLIRGVIKPLVRVDFVKKLLSKFYHLAKKI